MSDGSKAKRLRLQDQFPAASLIRSIPATIGFILMITSPIVEVSISGEAVDLAHQISRQLAQHFNIPGVRRQGFQVHRPADLE